MDDILRVLKLLQQHGKNSVSFQVLDSGFDYWFDNDDACIAYVDTGRVWVVAGAPICDLTRWPTIVEAFKRYAAAKNRYVVFFAADQAFAQASGMQNLAIGEQPVWDPQHWAQKIATNRNLKKQLRRARAHGVVVRSLVTADLASPTTPCRQAIEQLMMQWQKAKPMPPMGFLVRVEPFGNATHKRFFVAEMGDAYVGFLAIVPVYGRQGWLFDDLIRSPVAPNGTAEALIDAAMCEVARLGSRYVTLGLVPLSGSVSCWLSWIKKMTMGFYHFAGLRAFKAKLHPDFWEPIYLSYPVELSALSAIARTLQAFAPRGFLYFAWQTLTRSPRLAAGILAAALLPWTMGLAWLDAQVWFFAPWIQHFWVVFDLALAMGLGILSYRWYQPLATILAIVVSLDALVTAVEVMLWHRPFGFFAQILKGLAVVAPSLAAVVLWKVRSHMHWLRVYLKLSK